MQRPIAEMGRIAIDLARRVFDSGDIDHVVLEPSLLIRSSTGPAR